jgi:hypothetical protein
MKRVLIVVGLFVLLNVALKWAGMAGALQYDRQKLEAERAAGRHIRKFFMGYLQIADDVTPELAGETIDSLTVVGTAQVSESLQDTLKGRINVIGTLIYS